MGDNLHILIVEDNADDTEMVQMLLAKTLPGVTFELATSEKEFLLALDGALFDVILADNSLPQFDATEALLILKSKGLRVPFILVTGTVSEEFAAGIIKLGADDYILKDRLTRLPSAIISAIRQCKADAEEVRSHLKLMQSEERYRTLIERISDAFIAVDKDWRYIYVNTQAGLLTHRDPASLIGKFIWEEFPDAVGSSTYNDFTLAMKEQRYISSVDYYAPLDLWQENHIYPSPDGLSVFIRDITTRKKAENEILQMNAELRRLSSHLQNVREQERIRIAREIHDELGQQLTGLKMDIQWLQKKLPAVEQPISEKISAALVLIDDTVKSVRRIASDLRPSMLDDLGLIAALEWHTQDVATRSGLQIEFSSSVNDSPISLDLATNIFRIYQEILTNVVRHASATKVLGSFSISNNHLVLEIRDDGVGVDLSKATSKKTLGLLGIKERAHIFGGDFEFNSEVGKGTGVRVRIPYL